MANTLVLSAEDARMMERLKTYGVLQPLHGNKMHLGQGVILVSCSDGDQMPHIFDKKMQLCREHGQERVHTCSLNGGALFMAHMPHFSRTMRADGNSLMRSVQGAIKLKDITSIALYTHAPCGIARQYGWTIEQQVEYLIAAKTRVKAWRKDLKVACFFHCDFEDKGKEIFFVPKHMWEEYRASHALASAAA